MLYRAFNARLLRRCAFVLLAASLVVPLAPRYAGAVVFESQAKCQKAISKAGRTYTRTKLKTLARCSLERLLAPGTDPCSDVKVLDKLAKADGKFDGAVAKACDALGDDELTGSRPEGLSLAPLAALGSSQRTTHSRLIARLTDLLTRAAPSGGGSAPSEDAADCQSALNRAVSSAVAAAFKRLASNCHDREDAGKTVTGETSRIVEACIAETELLLDANEASILEKVHETCSEPELAELGACPALETGRTVASVTQCLLDEARELVAAAIASGHGRDGPQLIGRILARIPGQATTVPAAGVPVKVLGEDGNPIVTANTDSQGRVKVKVVSVEVVVVCWDPPPGALRTCSDEPIDVGLEPVYFGERTIDMPLAPGQQAIAGVVTRADASPCYEASTVSDFALQGGVRVTASGLPPGGARTAVASSGEFIVAVPTSGPHTLHADCGAELASLNLGPPPYSSAPVEIHMSNTAPSGGTIDMTDSDGLPLTDPSTVEAGEVVSLHASFTDTDALEYRWEIVRGNGRFVGPNASTDDRRASGPDVQWEVGSDNNMQQVTLWTSDAKGGIESIVVPIGPIDVGPIASPCIEPPKLQKLLCATGYTAIVPTPQAGLSEFLVYKYRNASRNSAGDACAYYNIVDPDCIDMNCDGVVDAGTDPLNKCKRTTLGGWWQKNGFDSVGLGPDVVTAWYLNANDLGFGREMHCRVTSWSSIIAERPVDQPTSAERLVQTLRADLQASLVVAQYAKLFNLYPSTVACYVTNYTTDHCFNYPTNDPANANLAYQGQQNFVANPLVNPTNAYGTVAMEFGPVEGFSQVGAITKFFVYNGRTASGKRLTAANLDGCGPKSVPELCMNCHGGDWPGDWSQNTNVDNMVLGLSQLGNVLAGIDANDTAPTDPGYILRRDIIAKLTREENGFSSFLPFDPDTYVFPAAASSAVQAPDIRKLNQLVLYTKPVDPVRDLIKGWYGNNLVSGTFAPWRPTLWNDDGGQAGDESDLHDDVYAVACRGCHAAHYSFPTWSNFPPSSRICKNGSGLAGGFKTMPHAKLTYLNLWKGDFPQATTFATVEAWYALAEGGFLSCD